MPLSPSGSPGILCNVRDFIQVRNLSLFDAIFILPNCLKENVTPSCLYLQF